MKKYFDIETPIKKMNGWDRSLLELTRMMNGTEKLHDPTKRGSNRKAQEDRKS